jgi:SPP1 gp7 family putative phage head morphogenesis protein
MSHPRYLASREVSPGKTLLVVDRAKNKPTLRTRKAERQYAQALRRLAEQVGGIVGTFTPGDPAVVPTLTQMLRAYADALTPWAEATARRMVEDVNARNLQDWRQMAANLSDGLRRQVLQAPVGKVTTDLLALQVDLIKSIPLDAAQRVQRLTIEGLENSTRAREIAREIQRTSEVSQSRAMLIARTEVSRTAMTLTQARAEAVQSVGYIWRTSGDGDVRPSHKAMANKFVRWDAPPTLDGLQGHAGCLPNCRCYVEPVLPE